MIEEFKKGLTNIKKEVEEKINSLRTHRLSLSFLENFSIEIYSQKLPLKSLGFISQIDPLTFRFDPYDQNSLPEIEKFLLERKQNFNLRKEKNSLIIKFPPLTEEFKKEIIKSLSNLKEETKIKARQLRDDFLRKLKKQKEEKEISEDYFYKTKENLDKEIEKFNDEVEKIFSHKEKEILG